MVELKLAAPRPVEMAERLCGMANAQGGVVIIGVKDSNHEIVGVQENRLGETLDVILRAARQIVKPELVLEPPEPEMYTLAGKKLVVATVRPSRGPVYQSGGIFWIRRGTHTIPMNLAETLELANDRGLLDWETLPAHGATMADIDPGKVEAHLQRRLESGGQFQRFENVEQALIGMKCALVRSGGDVVPTNAGILFTKRLGLPPPEFREINEFVVTFRAAPALQPRQGQAQYPGTLWKEEEPPPPLPAEREPDNLEGRLVKAVGYVNEHGFITNKIYRNLTGVSERTARRDLEVLEERGRLKALGKRRARRYELP